MSIRHAGGGHLVFHLMNITVHIFLLQASYDAAYVYDATYLYLLAVEDTIAQGGDPRNGSQLFTNAIHKEFMGMLVRQKPVLNHPNWATTDRQKKN